MSNDFKSYENENLSIKEKFYLLMDLLVTNQSVSRREITIFFFIFYAQFITGYFSIQINILDPNNSFFDKILALIEKTLRLFALLQSDLFGFEAILILLLIFIILSILYFLLLIKCTTKISFYAFRETVLNFSIKLFLYVFFHISLGFSSISFCFESTGNYFIENSSCSIVQNPVIISIALVLFFMTIAYYFFIQTFYYDCFMLSRSLYAKSACNYDYYIGLHTIIYSVLLTQVRLVTNIPFLIYNFVVSIVLCYYYFYVYLFFSHTTNTLVGLFHVLYVWTSLFFLIFNFVGIEDKGLAFVLLSFFIVWYYFVKRFSIEKKIIFKTPYYKITNTYHLIFYIKTIIDKINIINENEEERALLIGILQMHINECPNPNCITKHSNPIYLPLSNEWSYRDKPMINDPIFLNMFIIVVYNYFLSLNYYSPDMMVNVSLYYLIVIGNVCQSIYFYNKVKEMNMSYKQGFSLKRLGITIEKKLVENLKSQNEACYTLEDLNTSLFFKYEELSFQLLKELSNDIEQNMEFWKILKQGKEDILNFNDIFYLVDKIRLSKIQVEILFKKLFEIFNGVNDLFELYLNYVETINDDDVLKRDLEAIKRKSETTADMIHFNNYYSILFNKDTGIIIANGDKGKEGIIEKTNRATDAMFGYDTGKLKGTNVSSLMPKILKNKHKSFMEHYFQTGEKKIIDQRDFKTYGKDKDNAIILITLLVKLFPILNGNIYFVSLLMKEKIDDIILTDNKFNIQGMSQQLMSKLFIESKQLFQVHDIPFYVICKQFVNFYKNFLQVKKLNKKKTTVNKLGCLKCAESDISLFNSSSLVGLNNEDEAVNQKVNENVEINENIELEYGIRIPQFIIDYMSQGNEKEKQRLEENYLNIDEEGEENISFDDDNINTEEISEPDEKKPILNIKNEKSMTKKGRASINTDNKPLVASILKTTGMTQDKRISELEMSFQKCLDKFKNLFQSDLFHDLEDYIDSLFESQNHQEYKFNFTFNRFKYGNKEVAYVIRCIDNKTETDLTSDTLDSMKENTFLQKTKKENSQNLKKLYEHLFDEKIAFINRHQDFLYLSLEDPAFQEKLNENKEDMIKMSRIFGLKKNEAVLEDENSSQSCLVGYNEDLSKKNRIEEIRKGVMNKVSKFYILKYYRINAVFTIVLTLAFCLFNVFNFFSIMSDLERILDLFNKLYQKTNWVTSLLSTLLSLKAMYDITQSGYPLNYATFLEDKTAFVALFQNTSIDWCSNISTQFGIFESQIAKYLGNNQDLFWGNMNVFVKSDINDQESYPLALEQIVGNVNALLHNELFFKRLFNKEKGDVIENSLLEYHITIAITNTYHAFLSIDFDKLLNIPIILIDYNNTKMTTQTNIIIFYCSFLTFCLIFYSILIYCTNSRIGEGFEKVAKIKLERIDDVINKITSFQSIFKRYQEFLLNEEKTIVITSDNIEEEDKNQNNTANLNKRESMYLIENKKDIKLNLLSVSYLQILFLGSIVIGFIIPIYYILFSLTKDTNTHLLINKYIYGSFLVTTGSLIELKAMAIDLKKNPNINYTSLFERNALKDVIISMQSFEIMFNYYNQMKVDICNATYLNVQSENYSACFKDIETKKFNNTLAVIQTVSQKTSAILWDISQNPNKDYMSIFNLTDYAMIEKYHFYFIIPISDNLAIISKESLTFKLTEYKNCLFILLAMFAICMACDFIFVWIFFMKRIIHLLSVSRCVLKVIPIIIINNTQEIVSWIENMN